jgi:hypothetical protein
MCAAAVAKARDLSMVIPSEPVVRIEELNHFYGHGASRSPWSTIGSRSDRASSS